MGEKFKGIASPSEGESPSQSARRREDDNLYPCKSSPHFEFSHFKKHQSKKEFSIKEEDQEHEIGSPPKRKTDTNFKAVETLQVLPISKPVMTHPIKTHSEFFPTSDVTSQRSKRTSRVGSIVNTKQVLQNISAAKNEKMKKVEIRHLLNNYFDGKKHHIPHKTQTMMTSQFAVPKK